MRLQEVDHFHDLLAPALEACGYDGHFLPKGRESDADGSDIFYRRTRYVMPAHCDWSP